MPVIGSPPRLSESIAQLARLAREHRVELIAIGNGTATRRELIRQMRITMDELP
jgi:transcriptional accessory protein Tex/SPT6